MLRGINLYLAFEFGPKCALVACCSALKNDLLASRGTFKSALFACCHRLKVPFSWKLYHALFGDWGETLLAGE